MDEKISIFKQIWWSIIKPKRLFERIKEKPILGGPLLIMIAGAILISILTINATSNFDYSQLDGMSPADLDRAKNLMDNPLVKGIQFVGTAISSIFSFVFSIFLKGIILWLLFKIMKGKGKLMQSVSIVAVSWIPLFFRNILQAAVGIGDIAEQMSSLEFSSYTFSQILSMNFAQQGIVFMIWNIVLLIIGYSMVFDISKTKAAIGVIGYWIIGYFISSGFSYLTLKNLSRFQGIAPKS